MSMTDELLEEWELWGRAAGWADRTIECRLSTLQRLSREATCPLEELTPLDLARWLSTKPTQTTRATYWRHARSFFAWLKVAGTRLDDPDRRLQVPEGEAGQTPASQRRTARPNPGGLRRQPAGVDHPGVRAPVCELTR